MYYAQAKNQALAAKKDPEANYWADKVVSCFQRDSILTDYYHKTIADGKWNHLMSQIHIGYTSWNNPEKRTMPKITRVPERSVPYTFKETKGYVSIEAEHFTRAVSEGKPHGASFPDSERHYRASPPFPSP